MTVPPPHGAGHASQCSNTRIAATHTRPWSNIRDRIGRLCARVRGLVVTVKPLQRRISDSPHRSGDCPTTAWCGARLTVLEHPHCGHSHASVVKYPHHLNLLADEIVVEGRRFGRVERFHLPRLGLGIRIGAGALVLRSKCLSNFSIICWKLRLDPGSCALGRGLATASTCGWSSSSSSSNAAPLVAVAGT